MAAAPYTDAASAAAWMKRERVQRDWSTTVLATRAREIAADEGSSLKLTQQSISDFEQPGKRKRIPDWIRYVRMAFEADGAAHGVAEEPAPYKPRPSTTLDELAIEHGLVFLDEIDLPLGMGASFLSGHAEVMGVVPFRSDWLRGLHEGPLDRLKVTRGRGDSMQPTIMDGDIVIVDTAHRRIDDQDRIWAVAYGDLGMIRRVRVTPRGSWLLMPDNEVVRPDEVGDGEVAVIGRVIWIGRRI
jgi:hypothetical protein